MNHSTLIPTSSPHHLPLPPLHSTAPTRFSLSLSHHISRISYFISLFFSCYSTCAGMLLLLRNFRLKVVIWVTQSTRGRENMCPLLGTVRYAFLQDSFGCFLDLMVAENPPFWRYTMFISCYIFRAWFFFFPFTFLDQFVQSSSFYFIFFIGCVNMIFYFSELCRSWLVYWNRLVGLFMRRHPRVLFSKTQIIRLDLVAVPCCNAIIFPTMDWVSQIAKQKQHSLSLSLSPYVCVRALLLACGTRIQDVL